MSTRIALIGFGEVGQILASDLAAQGFRDLVDMLDQLLARVDNTRDSAGC